MRFRSFLATNSVLGQFGIGGPAAHILRVLSEKFGPTLAIARGCGISTPASSTVRVLKPPLWVRALSGTRLGRFAIRSQEAERIEFDRRAARASPECDLAVVENGNSRDTSRRLVDAGARIVLMHSNHPFAQMAADVEEERRRWGGPAFFVNEEQLVRSMSEISDADFVINMSDSVLKALEDDGVPRTKLRRARYGVDLERFRPASRAPEGFLVAFVGWLDLRKGYPYLVNGFRDAAVPGARLLLHGGSNAPFHHELVRRLRGPADVEVVRGPVESTYAAAAVTVLPSVSEAFGHVVLESMACGVPPIVTDRCGASEIVTDGVDGFVIPARDSDAIRDRLLRLHGDPDLHRRMGEAARRKALSIPWSLFEDDIRVTCDEALAKR